jgi:hypothetical protein
MLVRQGFAAVTTVDAVADWRVMEDRVKLEHEDVTKQMGL